MLISITRQENHGGVIAIPMDDVINGAETARIRPQDTRMRQPFAIKREEVT